MTSLNWLQRNKDVGVLLLRLFIGVRLIYGVIDNVTSWEHMLKFRDFLQVFHFPVPLVSAVVSVYAQLIAALLIVLGFKIRFASLVMIFNFLVAIIMVHRNDTMEALTPALMMIFSCLLFLFQGAGKFSVDHVKGNDEGR